MVDTRDDDPASPGTTSTPPTASTAVPAATGEIDNWRIDDAAVIGGSRPAMRPD